jgi:hypothetical protein
MTSFAGDAIRPLRGYRPAEAEDAPQRTPVGDVTRRSVLAWTVRLGTIAGLGALGVAFPGVRRAQADGYDIYGQCPSYAATHNCSPGCGPSMVFDQSIVCVPSGQTRAGYHKAGPTTTYKLRPNECYGTTDGWLWYYSGPCDPCRYAVEYRCHDGWYKYSTAGFVKSICRWRTVCLGVT